jgi:glycosyltransferase involved in cell wall biosynthesis
MPLVSIIIPCYNQAQFLGEAIESVLAQSYSNFEIVVVDDGSSDNTSEVAARYSGVRCIRQDNQGLAATRNAGLGQSNGDYLVFLDADDRLLPQALEAGLASFETHPDCAFVAGHHRLIGIDGSLLEELPPHRVAREHYADLLRRNYIVMHAAVMYRREVFDSVGNFNTSLKACEDYDLYLRIARQWPIYCHAHVVAEYRQHGANMTQNPALMLESALTVLRSQWPAVQGNARFEEAYRAGMRFWQGYYGARLGGQKDKLAIVEILKVTHCEIPNEQLWGRNLEAPQPGNQSAGHILELAGWVLGRRSPAVAIEVIAKSRLLRRATIDIRRPDVAAHHPDVVTGEQSGFHTWVEIPGIGDQELLVQAVLQDHGRVPLARVSVRRRWRSNAISGTAPFVSVIIPCYNQARFLGEAIESVLAQTYPHFEVVVVDDGSMDNTEEVAGCYPSVRCLRQANQGLAAARNAGLQHSRGEYIVFLDADDRLLPEALGTGLEAFEAHPDCALVAGHYRLIGVEGGVLEEMAPRPMTGEHYRELLQRNFIRTPAAVMYRCAIFASVKPFDTTVNACADYDLYLRITRQFPIYWHGQIIAEYRQHAANMTRNPALMLKSVLHVLRSQWKEVSRNAEYKKAYKVGWKVWQDYYGEQLVSKVRSQCREHEWKQALSGILTLLRYYPCGIASFFCGHALTARRIQEIVRTTLPPHAGVIVVSKSDDKLVKLAGRQTWHLPQAKVGVDPESYPVTSVEVIEQLDEMRAKSGDFLLFPSTAFWWLQRYGEFRLHLEAQYRRVWSDERCIIYQLSENKELSSVRILVAGWFSFEDGHATAGDLLARDVVCSWLDSGGYGYEVAVAPPFRGDVEWRCVNPESYSHVVFVCGPFANGNLESQFLAHFNGCRLIGLDLTMLVPLNMWNPFDLLIERDSSVDAHADIVFASRRPLVPVVGVCLVEPYEGAIDNIANAAIERLIASRQMAVVKIDTRLDANATGLRNPAEVESLLARMDVVVTTRLHGMVLALKNGVPVIAIDPEAGGRKIRRQAQTIGWDTVFNADALTDQALQEALEYCLTEAARTKVRECCERAVKMVQDMRDVLLADLAHFKPRSKSANYSGAPSRGAPLVQEAR